MPVVILLGLIRTFLPYLMKGDVEHLQGASRKGLTIIWAMVPTKCLGDKLKSTHENSHEKMKAM